MQTRFENAKQQNSIAQNKAKEQIEKKMEATHQLEVIEKTV